MNFTIEQTPPVAEALQADRGRIEQQIRSITQQDTLITFVLILLTSTAFGFAVFWSTDSIKYAAIAFSVFPVIGVIAALTGLIATVGFRSNALRMIELKNELIALNPVSDDSIGDIRRLSEKYVQVDIYRRKVEDQQRALVNGELAMFWEWDATTQARTAKQRAYLESARDSVQMSVAPTPLH